MAARPHAGMHFRVQAVGLGPREYAALAARAHRASRVREALWRLGTVALGALAIGVIFLAIGAPLWLSVVATIGAFFPLLRAHGISHSAVVVERHVHTV